MNASDSAPVTVLVRASRSGGLYLPRCVASVGAQTLRPSAVVLVVQGAAPVEIDHASATLRAAGISADSVAGPGTLSGGLNRGLARIGTEWTAILDDDDTWDAEFLRTLWDAATASSAHSEVAAWVCSTTIVHEVERGARLETLGRRVFNPPPLELSAGALACANRFTIHAALWRTSCLRELGGFREDLAVLEDWEFNVRAAERFELRSVGAALANYHRRPPWSAGGNTRVADHDRTAAMLREEWTARGLLPQRADPVCAPLLRLAERLRAARQRHMESLRWRFRVLAHAWRR